MVPLTQLPKVTNVSFKITDLFTCLNYFGDFFTCKSLIESRWLGLLILTCQKPWDRLHVPVMWCCTTWHGVCQSSWQWCSFYSNDVAQELLKACILTIVKNCYEYSMVSSPTVNYDRVFCIKSMSKGHEKCATRAISSAAAAPPSSSLSTTKTTTTTSMSTKSRKTLLNVFTNTALTDLSCSSYRWLNFYE